MFSLFKRSALNLAAVLILLGGLLQVAMADEQATVFRGQRQIAVCMIGCSEEFGFGDTPELCGTSESNVCNGGANDGDPCQVDLDCGVCDEGTCAVGGNIGNACSSDTDCQVCSGPTAITIAWYDENNNLLKDETFDPVAYRGVVGLYYGPTDGEETILRCEGPDSFYTEGDVATAVLDARGPRSRNARGPGCNPEERPESPCWRVTALANDG